MSAKQPKTELKMTNKNNTIRDGPADVKGALKKLKKCQAKKGKDCTKQKQILTRVKAKSCTGKNAQTGACTDAAKAYKFHPVYGNLRY